MSSTVKTYGAELEKVVSNKTTKQSHKTSQDFFKILKKDVIRKTTLGLIDIKNGFPFKF